MYAVIIGLCKPDMRHSHQITDPLKSFSILEPAYLGGCQDQMRATLRESQDGHGLQVHSVKYLITPYIISYVILRTTNILLVQQKKMFLASC